MAKAPKYKEQVFPLAIAKFTYLDTPQEPYDGKGDAQYKIRVLIDDTAENRERLDDILNTARAEAKKNGVKLKKVHKNPLQYPEDQDEEDYEVAEGKEHAKLDEDHKDRIFFTTTSKFKPGLIDTARQSLADGVRIMSGDKVRVKCEVLPYEGLGSGISFRLKVVQLVEKNTSFAGGQPNTDGFDDIDGFVGTPDDEDEDEQF
jgi:hypothetical protein